MAKESTGQKRKPVRAPQPGMTTPSRRQQQREAFRTRWHAVDWSKQDVELTTETGLSRQRIGQIRQIVGAPRSPHHKRMLACHHRITQALQWAADNLGRLRGLTGAELERNYGFRRDSPVGGFLKAKGLLRDGRLVGKHRYELMNWGLPSQVLGRIWRLPSNVASNRRARKRLRAPRWKLTGGRTALGRRGELRAYNRAVQAEERKAAQYFAESGRL